MVALMLSAVASAFCGAYVGPVGSTLENGASRIVVARQDGRVTLTMANDVSADVSDFAMVVPVPEILGPADVRLVDRDWIDQLDSYTAPRLVSYTCDQLGGWDSGYYGHTYGSRGCPLGCSGGEVALTKATADSAVASSYGGTESALDSVKIEAEFAIGAYEVVVLSAEESGDLLSWLQLEGYAVPDGGEAVLQEYIDAGLYFFAVRVSLDELPDGAFLEPIQFGYPQGASDAWTLPTRLGALNSSGRQEVLLFTLTSPDAGRTRPQNAGPVDLEDDCMPPDDDVDAFFEDHLDTSFGGVSPGYTLEYSWPGWEKCDPCSPGFEEVDPQMLEALGYVAASSEDFGYQGYEVYLTRLRLRYDAATAQDLIFEPTRDGSQNEQIRFIQYEEYLESEFPICGQGMAENPGSCDDELARRVSKVTPRRSLGMGFWGLLLAGGLLLRRRL